ncbi:MAG: prepilin-type cleavage/methylation domain-containing protein [bacterium]|nr:prepilin-type cleavage/methylation domain-containing protein [bacterium]
MVELLVSVSIVSLVGGAALTLALSGRAAFELDQARNDLQQNLRAGMDFLVTDVRVAGQRLPQDFTVVEIVDGSAGAPDQLIVRRNKLATVLRVCADISAGSGDKKIFVAQTLAPITPGCSVVDDDADGWPENLQDWKEYREARVGAGNPITAYIYNPASQVGEFFEYAAEHATLGYRVQLGAAPHTWANEYLVTENSRLYFLEERTYEIQDGVLQMIEDGDAANPVRLVDDVTDFQVRALFQDGSSQDAFGAGDDWTDLRAIEVTLASAVEHRNHMLAKSWTNEILPRNVISD